jgi:hypothetical protein
MVASAPRSQESQAIAQLGLDLERLSSNGERLRAQIDAIDQSLPIFKATLGHEDFIWELASQRDHPVHELLRRFSEEFSVPTTPTIEASTARSESSWRVLQSWIGGSDR